MFALSTSPESPAFIELEEAGLGNRFTTSESMRQYAFKV